MARLLAGLLVLVLCGIGSVYVVVQHGGNVHAVEDGVVYRSAQLSGDELDRLSRAVHLRSVVNLRGNNAGKPWYDEEMRVSRADHLAHVDFALSAERDVTPAEMDALLALLRAAPKPVLIHCNAGADRSGLASALYLLSRGVPPARASRQLSLRYGHVPYLWSKTDAMDRSLDRYVRAHPAPGGH